MKAFQSSGWTPGIKHSSLSQRELCIQRPGHLTSPVNLPVTFIKPAEAALDLRGLYTLFYICSQVPGPGTVIYLIPESVSEISPGFSRTQTPTPTSTPTYGDFLSHCYYRSATNSSKGIIVYVIACLARFCSKMGTLVPT